MDHHVDKRNLDYAAIAVSDLANISERRLERLVNPDLSGLPAFLIRNPGLSSGYMMLQVMAASLVSENKILSHPASVDSIPTSGNKEDHVSMGMSAALKFRSVVGNAEIVLAGRHHIAPKAAELLQRDALVQPAVERREAEGQCLDGSVQRIGAVDERPAIGVHAEPPHETGEARDQAELAGVLNRIFDLNLTLLSVERGDPSTRDSEKGSS